MVLPVNTLMVMGSFEMYPVGFSWPVVLKVNNNEAHKLAISNQPSKLTLTAYTCVSIVTDWLICLSLLY